MHAEPESVPELAEGRLRVVLDMDETLVFARTGPILAREGVRELLVELGECPELEVIVWTAGVAAYARAVLGQIDSTGCIKHCVHRGPGWWRWDGSKDLAKLRTPLSRIVMVENTPECCALQPYNAVVVPSFFHPNPLDTTAQALADILLGASRCGSSVIHFLREHPRLRRRSYCCDGTFINTNFLIP